MRSLYRSLTCTLLFGLLTVVTSNSLLLADVTGSILGVVRDKTQAVIAGARLTATNVETNLSRETTSATDGSYRFLALPAGTYKVSATAPGFQQYTTTDIDVRVNDQLKFDITLEVGSVQQTVEVTASA